MRKIILSVLAALTLAAPLATAVDASAQSRQELREERRDLRQDRRDDRREIRRERREIREDRRELRRDLRETRRPAWLKRGGHYRNGGVVIRDHRRYGLRNPGRGQRWVRYGNEYLLVGIASGVIASIIATR